MSKKQDRRSNKKFKSEITKQAVMAMKLAKTPEQKEAIKQQIRLTNWVAGLTREEAEFMDIMNKQQARDTLDNYSNSETLLMENFLLENGFDSDSDQVIKNFEKQMEIEGIKIQEFIKRGEDYFMALKDDSKKIIKDYEELKAQGLKDKDIKEKLWLKYPKYSKNAVKNVILRHSKVNCESTTCQLAKEDWNCGNEVVLSGKADCHNYVPEGTKKIDEVKITKIETKHNKKDEIFKFFEVNKSLSKEELKKKTVDKFNITNAGFHNYYYLWNKDRKPATENEEFKEAIKDMESKGVTKLKEISKTVSITAEVQGEAGTYHVKNNKVSINDGIPFNNREEVKIQVSDKVKKLQEQINELNSFCSEMLAVFDMYNL